jgi:hypothetical protein
LQVKQLRGESTRWGRPTTTQAAAVGQRLTAVQATF